MRFNFLSRQKTARLKASETLRLDGGRCEAPGIGSLKKTAIDMPYQ
jgi:hypothetical protein